MVHPLSQITLAFSACDFYFATAKNLLTEHFAFAKLHSHRGEAWPGKAGPGEGRQGRKRQAHSVSALGGGNPPPGTAWQGPARRGPARQGMGESVKRIYQSALGGGNPPHRGEAWLGGARHGMARLGEARAKASSAFTKVRLAVETHHRAWLGTAGRGSARYGPARQGRKRQAHLSKCAWRWKPTEQLQGILEMEIIRARITGTRPFIMHNDRLANPLDPMAKTLKALTVNRTKTDEIHEAIAQTEWAGGLYHDAKEGPYIPSRLLEGAICDGAKASRLGTKVKQAVEVMDEINPLIYEGPRTVEDLWEAQFYDVRSVVVGGKRIMRTRPLFRQWAAEFRIVFDEAFFNKADLVKALNHAGNYTGLGDYRPKFGRFAVEIQ